MVALVAGLILIALVAVAVTLVDAAGAAYWRIVAAQRRLSWEEHNAASVGENQRPRR